MYLKEIVTSGFKSFAEKMNIVLNDETTCIVGPNGSGKSNIVDAVRWVLGEQSVKSLRGEGSMSDVIFAGSASRKSKNAASVELIFDNHDHYLNINYTEVSVKRRVYRSGENEYFLNNEKCRLKDITDLFLDSGIGKESFNIIGQGEVDRILSDGKEDRRVVFEEAAGILKYKKRKEEALRKLDRTHASLERLEDIILELEKQVTPLKEQSEKAKIYLENKKALEVLEVSLLAYDIYNLNSELKLLDTEKEEIKKEATLLSSKNSISSSEILKEKGSLLELEKDLDFTQNELLRATEEVTRLDGELQVLRMMRKEKTKDKREEEARSLHTKQGELRKNLSNIKNSLLNLQVKGKDDTALWTRKKKEIEKEKQEKYTFEQEYSKMERDLLSYKHKIELLQLEQEKGSGLPPSVKKVLTCEKLTGIYDIIGNVVKTKEIYGKALEVAIASSKNFIIVKDEKSAKEAISYLKNKNLGRATFFPLTVIEPRKIAQSTLKELEHIEGFHGVLASHIKTEEKYQNIIDNQFGLTLLAEDVDSALLISKQVNRKYKVITLGGDVINVGGSMTGGASYKGRSGVMIQQEITSYKNTISSLQNSSKKYLEDLKLITTKISTLEEDVFHLTKSIEYLKEEEEKTQGEIKQLEKEIKQVEDHLSTLEDNSDVLDEKEKNLIDSFYAKASYKEKLEQKKKSLQKEVEEERQKIDTLEENEKYQNSILRKKEEQIKELEIKHSRIDVKLDSMLDTLTTEYSMTYEKARRDYILEIEDKEARKKVEKYKTVIKDLGMVNLAAIEEYDRVSTRYEFLLHQKEDLLTAEGTLLTIMDEMDEVMKEEFKKTYDAIKIEFEQVFQELFHGGHATLELTSPDDLLTTGIDIIASPPGKRLTTIHLLSGGEKTLTAISLLFAILNVRKVPFCIFDEVEAALDEANVDQFGKYLDHYKNKTQFLIITHKKKTMEYADTLYGITMQESGVSKLVSVKLENKEEYL